ncbi:MAG: TetR/AcrR family transcriptional regulator [bacterium]|nr:TetR/AcrR family transcriptional regulator [bacterium]
MPKIVDKNQKRREIAVKAIQVFAEKGYENATIQEIAEAAGIGKGTIYEYFSNKMDILTQVTLEFMTEMEKSLKSTFMEISDPGERLMALMLEPMRDIDSIEMLMVVYMEIWGVHIRGASDELKNIFDSFLEGMRQATAAIIEEGKESGIFRADTDSESVALYLVASLDGIGLHYIYDKSRFQLIPAIEGFLKTLFNGLLSDKGRKKLKLNSGGSQ